MDEDEARRRIEELYSGGVGGGDPDFARQAAAAAIKLLRTSKSVERRLAIQAPALGHTPHPWRFVRVRPGWDEVYGPRDEHVADVNLTDGADDPETYPSDANGALIAMAPTAPHHCEHEGCPGRENKRKLEAFDLMLPKLEWNTRRMEAFDDLLAACKALVGGIDTWNDSVQTIIGRVPDYHWGALEAARAAIAKAEATK